MPKAKDFAPTRRMLSDAKMTLWQAELETLQSETHKNREEH